MTHDVAPLQGSIANVKPQLLAWWDYEENQKRGLDPSQVLADSSVKASWICLRAPHRTLSSMPFRTCNSADKKIKDMVSGKVKPCCWQWCQTPRVPLSKTHPHLVAEWNEEKNEALGLILADMSRGSKVKAWWNCTKCQTPRLQAVMDRAVTKTNTCCPEIVSLADTDPLVAADWNHDLNEAEGCSIFRITRGSTRKVWWNCTKCNKSYQAQVRNRTAGTKHGCDSTSVSKIETTIFTLLQAAGILGKQQHRIKDTSYKNGKDINTDIFCADTNLVIEYDGQHWHAPEDVVQRDTEKTQALLDAGYKVVRIREHSSTRDLPFLAIKSENLIQVKFNHTKNPKDVEKIMVEIIKAISTLTSK